jgi:putative PIN family toxin of toxin-antitoxin system
MPKYQIVVDTNVLIAALRSNKGASYKLIKLITSGKFELNISVPLILEYESIAKRYQDETNLTSQEIDDIIDYVCSKANEREIYYLWRPHLKDPKDDMVLELAVAGGCSHIITFNIKDFTNIAVFGIEAIGPKEFLQIIGEI